MMTVDRTEIKMYTQISSLSFYNFDLNATVWKGIDGIAVAFLGEIKHLKVTIIERTSQQCVTTW